MEEQFSSFYPKNTIFSMKLCNNTGKCWPEDQLYLPLSNLYVKINDIKWLLYFNCITL